MKLVFDVSQVNVKFPDLSRCRRGGFRYSESVSGVENAAKRQPKAKTEGKNLIFKISSMRGLICFLV